MLAAGGISSVDRVFALHCDPKLDVGRIATRVGAITAACDKIKIKLTAGPGGHTARPHLTADLVFALGKMITEPPPALSRRIDPRSGLSLVWGRVSAGTAPNAIPNVGVIEGTVRCLDDNAWHAAPDLLKGLVESVASAYGVTPDPAVRAQRAASGKRRAEHGDGRRRRRPGAGQRRVAAAPQSLGGEDFAWFLESIPGSLFRLGTRRPGSLDDYDIHQPLFDVDERCIGVGIKVMAATAMMALGEGCGPGPGAGPIDEAVTPIPASVEDGDARWPVISSVRWSADGLKPQERARSARLITISAEQRPNSCGSRPARVCPAGDAYGGVEVGIVDAGAQQRVRTE